MYNKITISLFKPLRMAFFAPGGSGGEMPKLNPEIENIKKDADKAVEKFGDEAKREIEVQKYENPEEFEGKIHDSINKSYDEALGKLQKDFQKADKLFNESVKGPDKVKGAQDLRLYFEGLLMEIKKSRTLCFVKLQYANRKLLQARKEYADHFEESISGKGDEGVKLDFKPAEMPKTVSDWGKYDLETTKGVNIWRKPGDVDKRPNGVISSGERMRVIGGPINKKGEKFFMVEAVHLNEGRGTAKVIRGLIRTLDLPKTPAKPIDQERLNKAEKGADEFQWLVGQMIIELSADKALLQIMEGKRQIDKKINPKERTPEKEAYFAAYAKFNAGLRKIDRLTKIIHQEAPVDLWKQILDGLKAAVPTSVPGDVGMSELDKIDLAKKRGKFLGYAKEFVAELQRIADTKDYPPDLEAPVLEYLNKLLLENGPFTKPDVVNKMDENDIFKHFIYRQADGAKNYAKSLVDSRVKTLEQAAKEAKEESEKTAANISKYMDKAAGNWTFAKEVDTLDNKKMLARALAEQKVDPSSKIRVVVKTIRYVPKVSISITDSMNNSQEFLGSGRPGDSCDDAFKKAVTKIERGEPAKKEKGGDINIDR